MPAPCVSPGVTYCLLPRLDACKLLIKVARYAAVGGGESPKREEQQAEMKPGGDCRALENSSHRGAAAPNSSHCQWKEGSPGQVGLPQPPARGAHLQHTRSCAGPSLFQQLQPGERNPTLNNQDRNRMANSFRSPAYKIAADVFKATKTARSAVGSGQQH